MSQRSNRITLAAVLAISLATLPTLSQADTPQSFGAKIDGKPFESDDDGILFLYPTKNTFNLIAKTKGASAYPPPKTPVDKMSITCRNFAGKPVKFVAKDFGSHGCEVRFIVGESKVPMGDPQAEYKLVGGNNVLEVTSVKGNVVEGTFAFELVDAKSKAKHTVAEGKFKAEDRQK